MKSTRAKVFVTAFVLGLGTYLHAAEMPSFVVILADELGYSIVNSYGAYQTHHADVMGHRGEPVRFKLGALEENPTTFTVRDWHPTQGQVIWERSQLSDDTLFINGYWAADVAWAGRYEIRLSRHDSNPQLWGNYLK